MLTKPEITSPVGAIRCFSALSRGVKAVLIPAGDDDRKLHILLGSCK